MAFFKKITFLFVLFFLVLTTRSFSEVVEKVQVKGNERITLETIVIFGDIAIGKNYETSDVNSLIKKLYETNFFSNISVGLENGLLTIAVKENPIINTIIIKGEKADKYKEAIKEQLNLREKTSFVNNYVKSDINIIKELYRSLGYYFIKIDLEIENLDKNRVNLVYTFDKGTRAKIAKIYFLGDK